MAKIFSVFNQAGGVGKTTLSMNLGYELSQRGKRILLLDFDPQGSLTIFMGLEPESLSATMYDYLMKSYPTSAAILPSLHGMDLLPANIGLGMAEMELVVAPMRESKLKKVLAPILESYDLILIDCLPSLGMLSYLSLVTSDCVLVPIDCEFKSYRGTDLLLQTVENVKGEANPGLSVFGFVPTKYSKAKTQHKRSLGAMNQYLSMIAPVFEPIPNAIAFADASEQGQPLATYDRRHEALKSIALLADQVCAELNQDLGALAHV